MYFDSETVHKQCFANKKTKKTKQKGPLPEQMCSCASVWIFQAAFCSRSILQPLQNLRMAVSARWQPPFPPIWRLQASTLHLTGRDLIISSLFLLPRCTDLNLIRCYITSARGCAANLIKKKQRVSPSLADSFTSWRQWEKTPLRRILQPL